MVAAGHAVIFYLLPRPYRKVLQSFLKCYMPKSDIYLKYCG